MNKKGFWLAGKIMSIIIAVACILILIFLGGKMLNIYLKGGQEVKQAEASLERIRQNIEIVENNPSIVKEFFIESPNGWGIVAWPHESIYGPFPGEEGTFPKKCYQFGYKKNCLCLCKDVAIKDLESNLKECNKMSACVPVNKQVNTIGDYEAALIKIKEVTVLAVSIDKNKIIIEKIGGEQKTESEASGDAR